MVRIENLRRRTSLTWPIASKRVLSPDLRYYENYKRFEIPRIKYRYLHIYLYIYILVKTLKLKFKKRVPCFVKIPRIFLLLLLLLKIENCNIDMNAPLL